MLHLDLLPFMKFMISYLEKWKQTQHHINASHEMVFKTREFEIHNILIHIQFHLKKITNCSDFIVSKKITE